MGAPQPRGHLSSYRLIRDPQYRRYLNDVHRNPERIPTTSLCRTRFRPVLISLVLRGALSDRKKLTWLSIGLFLYFCLMVFAVRYASTIPYQMLLFAAVLNMGIILTFVFSIVRVLRRMQGVARTGRDQGTQTGPQQGVIADERRLKLLWIGTGTYSLIFLNGLRLGFTYANSMPLAVLVLGELLNGAILATFIFELRKVQKNIRQKDRQPTDR